MNYYNDHDPNACAWMLELIKDGHLPPGDVDNRSILEVSADELRRYDQCHFFAGIGGWAYALALAGWEGPCWTGSCPCQPLSCAGQGKGHADERHLWPAFYALIAECKPATVFGEQVASKLGREWFAGVRADLEGAGYACGGANLPACSVGAPHKRERLFWVADAEREGSQGQSRHGYEGGEPGREREEDAGPAPEGRNGSMGDSTSQRGRRKQEHGEQQGECGVLTGGPSAGGFWEGAEVFECLDGKARRIEPSIPPLAHGIPGRVALLRGAGNAIVPQVAAEFVRAVL